MSINLSGSFGTAKQYIFRSPWLTFTSVLVMTLTFYITSIFITAGLSGRAILKHLETKAQITVFFKNETPEEKILAIKQNLEASGRVLEARYISQEEALKIYMGQHRDEPVLLESLSANIFPASLEIRAREIEDLPGLAKALGGKGGVEEVVFFKDVIETFSKWTEAFRLAATLLVAVLALISVLITLVTIGMTIYTRREEIEIMRLVGATDWFIRVPFLLQGALFGLVSAVVATTLFTLSAPVLNTHLLALLKGSAFPSGTLPTSSPLFVFYLFFGEVVLGIFLGIVGSLAAMRRYLRY